MQRVKIIDASWILGKYPGKITQDHCDDLQFSQFISICAMRRTVQTEITYCLYMSSTSSNFVHVATCTEILYKLRLNQHILNIFKHDKISAMKLKY